MNHNQTAINLLDAPDDPGRLSIIHMMSPTDVIRQVIWLVRNSHKYVYIRDYLALGKYAACAAGLLVVHEAEYDSPQAQQNRDTLLTLVRELHKNRPRRSFNWRWAAFDLESWNPEAGVAWYNGRGLSEDDTLPVKVRVIYVHTQPKDLRWTASFTHEAEDRLCTVVGDACQSAASALDSTVREYLGFTLPKLP